MSIVQSNHIVAEGYKISLQHKLQFYRGDRLNLAFSLSDALITRIASQEITDGVLPLDSTVLTAYMLLDGVDTVAGTIIENNKIIFKLLPEHQIIGISRMQIVLTEELADGTREVFHTPPFELEIREPIGDYEVSPDDVARVNYAIVGKSVVAMDDIGSQADITITGWQDGDVITASRLNAMLDAEFMDEDWEVQGVSVGAYKSGDVIPKGLSAIEIIKNMTTKEIPPTYTRPTISVTTSISGVQEMGTTITPTISVSYNQNDGGSITRMEVYRNNSLLNTLTTIVNPYRFTDTIALGSQTISYRAVIHYEEGAIKDSNLGNPYPTGHIIAGNVSANSSSITPYAPSFYGVLSSVPTTIEEIKTLTKRVSNNKNLTYSSINMVNSYIVYAYPTTLGNITSIKDGNGFEYINSYVATTMTDNGINYNVLYLQNPVSVTNFTQVFS